MVKHWTQCKNQYWSKSQIYATPFRYVMSSSVILVVYPQSRGCVVIFSCICFQPFKVHSLAKPDPLGTQYFPEKGHYNRLMNNNRDIIGLSFFDPNYRWSLLLPSQDEGSILFAQNRQQKPRSYYCMFKPIGSIFSWVNMVNESLASWQVLSHLTNCGWSTDPTETQLQICY